MRLSRSLAAGDPLEVARRLLGAVLTHRSPQGSVSVLLTEVEAYAGVGADPGSHAHRGPTPRTAVMFGPPARLYVYFSYGRHWCVNVVCEPAGHAGAVLLRAGRVTTGVDLARGRRPAARSDVELARGPARLAAALALDGSHNGLDVVDSESCCRIQLPSQAATAVSAGPRVGVRGAGGDGVRFPWRFWLDGDPTVSAYRGAAPVPQRPRSGAVRPDTLSP